MLLKLLVFPGAAVILALLIGAILCCIHFIRYYRYWEKRGVSVEGNFFLVQNLKKVFSGKIPFGGFLADIYKQHDKPYFGFYILGQPYLFVKDPQLIKAISVKDFNYFENRSLASNEKVDPVVAKSVFLARNPQWKDTRVRLNTLFSPSKIKSMVPTIVETSKKMQDYLETRDNQIVDFKVVAENLITNLGPLIFLGIESHCSFEHPDNTIKDAIKNVFGKGWYQGFAFFAYIFVPPLVPLFNIRLANYSFLQKAMRKVISYKKTNDVKGKQISDLLVNHIGKDGDANGNFFDENWLISQSLTLILAGFIPPSSLFSFTLHELSFNPDCQDKLRKEISETFSNDEEPSYEKVTKMKYLNMIICETLRRNPLGGFLNRICTRTYVIEESGLKIEKGTPLLVSVDAIHVDPKHYPNPDKFDPERFRDGTKDLENAGIFIPFGLGQKRCLGEKFTQLAVKMSLVFVLRKFKFEPCHLSERIVKVDPLTLSTSALNGIHLRIHKL